MYTEHCKNKYMPRLKNHLPSWARNHKSLCALGQDLHSPGMRARLNVEPWYMAESSMFNVFGLMSIGYSTGIGW